MVNPIEHDDFLSDDLKELLKIARLGASIADMELIRRVEDALKEGNIQCIRRLSWDEIGELEAKESIR